MEMLIIAVFFIGYFFITIEHSVRIDKTISALGMASVCWALLKLFNLTVYEISDGLHPLYIEISEKFGLPISEAKAQAIDELLLHHLGKIAEILFFLIGAMTIVEIVDMHRGFEILKKLSKPVKRKNYFGFLAPSLFFFPQ